MRRKKNLKTCILLSCYNRPEYTRKCLDSILTAQDYPDTDFYLVDDGSTDPATSELLDKSELPGTVVVYEENVGLRNVILDFFEWLEVKDYDYIGKIDNDCKVPIDWVNRITDMFGLYPELGIVSPNVYPSNAAYIIGRNNKNKLYRPGEYVGGLWYMKRRLINGLDFERHGINGIKGAFNILEQIIREKSPTIGWLPEIVVQDMGHWSGKHPEHIKTGEHSLYYQEVGRKTTW